MTSFDRPSCQETLAASFFHCVSDWNLDRLGGPLDEKVTVIMPRRNMASWHHMIRETRCQDVGCFIVNFVKMAFWICSNNWISSLPLKPVEEVQQERHFNLGELVFEVFINVSILVRCGIWLEFHFHIMELVKVSEQTGYFNVNYRRHFVYHLVVWNWWRSLNWSVTSMLITGDTLFTI